MPNENKNLFWLKLKNKIIQFFQRPINWLGWVFVLVMGYLIVVPLGEIIISSFRIQPGDTRRAAGEIGEWTLYYWIRTFISQLSNNIFYSPMRNTIIISVIYTLLAMTIGIVIAYLIVRTDLPFKKFIGFFIIIPYIVPSWTLALAWITLFGNHRVGVGAAGVFQTLFNIVPPDWVAYGPFPIIMVLSINYAAYTYLLASAAFSTIDSRLEESALLHGLSEMKTLRKITLPLILPALGSAFILTFAKGLGTFSVPAFLGIPVRFHVLSTSLYRSAGRGQFGDVFVLTLTLIFVAAITIVMNNILIGKRKEFTTMTGKGSTERTVKLGKFRKPIGVFLLISTFISAILPIGLLLWQSLQYNLGDYSLSNLSLAYWTGEVMGMQGILMSSRVRSAALNTLQFAVVVSVSIALIGILIGYIVTNLRGTKLSKVVEMISFTPYVIPGIAFGAIYLTMFAQPRGPIPALYGTLWILILAFMVKRLPFSSRTGISAMMQIGPSLEEAAILHGASFFTRLRKIIIPLGKNGFLTGFILAFVSTVKDLSLVVLLVTPSTMVLSALTLEYMDWGRRQFADAIGVVIVLMVLGGLFLAQWLTGTNPLEGFSKKVD